MGRVRVLERVAQESGTIGKFEKYRKVRSLAENNKEPRAVIIILFFFCEKKTKQASNKNVATKLSQLVAGQMFSLLNPGHAFVPKLRS